MRDSLDVCISNLHKKDIENVIGMRVCGSNMQKTRDIKKMREMLKNRPLRFYAKSTIRY